MDELTERCPSTSFVQIKQADISPERLRDLEIVIADPVLISKWLYKLPNVKWMQSTFAGLNHIFEELQDDKPFPPFVFTRLGGVFGPVMSEYVIGHIIARERKFALSWKYQLSKEWAWWEKLVYRELSELTIGILGFGEIGQEIGRCCHSMRMTVNSIHRSIPATKSPFVDECFSVQDLGECLKRCDYLCSVLPSTPSTKGLLSGDILENCKEKKTVLISIGRGDVISSSSILKALDNQWIGGAILDVCEEEPLSKDSALWTHPQVTITPHVSGLCTSSQVMSVFLENYERYKAGEPMKHVVNWSKGY